MTHILKQTFAILAVLILCAPQAQAEVHRDHHRSESHEKAITPQLNHGKRWATDASLCQGMERIRKAVSLAQAASADGVLNKAEAEALSSQIDDALTFMFTHCRLAPEADANLHILLEQLMHASESLKKESHAAKGLQQALTILEIYPQYFEHPGWKAEE